jgi:hypothetical protein
VIRVVLGVVLAVALLATAAPGVERARVAESETTLDRSADALRRAAAGLATDDATPAGVPGARRSLSVRVPGRAWTEAPVAFLAVGCDPGGCVAGATGAGGAGPRRSDGGAGGAGGSDGTERTGRRGLRADDAADVVSYRVRGRPTRRIRLVGVDVRTPAGPVVLAGPGRHRLTLTLEHGDRGGRAPVVAVRRGVPRRPALTPAATPTAEASVQVP